MYSSGFIVVGLILYCSCVSSCSRFFIVLVVDVVQSSNLSVPPTATTSCLLGFQNQHVFMSTGQHRALLCSTNSILTIAVMWERFMLNIYLALMVYLYYLYNPIYLQLYIYSLYYTYTYTQSYTFIVFFNIIYMSA